MLKADVGKETCMVQLEGNLIQVTTDVVRTIGAVFNAIQQKDETQAEMFRMAMQAELVDGSPVWGTVDNAVMIDLSAKKGGAPTGQS